MSEKEKPLTVEEPDLSRTYTAADYLRWNLDELVEVIRGKIYKMSPSPTSNHQRISMELSGIFYLFFKNKQSRLSPPRLMLFLWIPDKTIRKPKIL